MNFRWAFVSVLLVVSTAALCSCKTAAKAKTTLMQDKPDKGLNISAQVKEVENSASAYVNGNLEWTIRLELANTSADPISFGEDFMLMEGKPQEDYDGVYVVYHPDIPSARPGNYDQYHTAQAYALGAFVENWPDGTLRGYQNAGTYEMADPPEYKPRKTFCNTVLAPGTKQQFEISVKQGMWFKRELASSALLVLPETKAKSSAQPFRIILVLAPSATNKGQWEVKEKRVVVLKKDNLERLFKQSPSDLAMRVLALNWLTKVDTDAAKPILMSAIEDKNAGPMVVTSIQLLIDYNISPDQQVLQTIQELAADPKSKAWSHMIAARYLKASQGPAGAAH